MASPSSAPGRTSRPRLKRRIDKSRGAEMATVTRNAGSLVDLPLGAEAGGPPPGSTRGSVKPKAEPPSGRPREGEFSSPVTARRTARRASRPFLPNATSSPRPPQDHRAHHPASCPEAHRPQHQPSSIAPRLPSFVFHQLSHTLAARSPPTLTLHLAPPCTFVLWCVEEGVPGLERSGEAGTPFL